MRGYEEEGIASHLVLRAPRVACCVGLLPLPIRFCRGPLHGWGGRVGDNLCLAGKGKGVTPLWEIPFPHSLGLLYSAFTYYTGFKVNSGEYKVMGLAPYGEPKYTKAIYEHLIDVKPDGTFPSIWSSSTIVQA